MRAKKKLSLAAIVFILLFIGVYGFIIQNPPPKDEGHDVWIVIHKMPGNHGRNVWGVRDAFTGNKKVIIYRGHQVTWLLAGTDAYFQFPDTTTFEPSTEMPDGYTVFKKAYTRLQLTVKANADTGTKVYSVFCLQDTIYGKGGTPPEWEVK